MKKRHQPTMLCLAALSVLTAAHAQPITPSVSQPLGPAPADALQFRASAGIAHDSNVLRTPNGQSDEIGTLAAGVRFDKEYSLQRITLDAEVAAYRHRDLSELNYETLNYAGAWNFAVTPRLRGTLSAERRQYRDVTDTAEGTSRVDRRTDRVELLEAIYGIGGGWRALAGLTQTSSRSEEPRSFEASPTVRSLRVGGGYEFGSGASIYGRLRKGDGEYDNIVVGRDFDETETDVVARLPLTAKTTIDGRLGYLDREHDGAAGRDFSGVVGNFGVRYEITAKTSVMAGISRELGSYEFAGGGNVRSTRFYVGPTWRATDQITVNLRHQREDRDWRVVSAASPDAGREDISNWTSATVDWEPRRNVMLTASLRHERRNSNLAAFDYRATVVGVGAKLTF